MSYSYEKHKHETFTEAGQEALLATAFKAEACCRVSGVVTAAHLIGGMPGVTDSWGQLAVVDRLCELGYLREVTQYGDVAGQHRIFRWVARVLAA